MLHKKKVENKGQNKRGSAEIVMVLAIIILSIFLGGGLTLLHPQNGGLPFTPTGLCCDTPDCHPQTGSGQTLTFTSPTSKQFTTPQEYGLLKSNATLYECGKHLKDSGQTVTYPNGTTYKIIRNTSDTQGECGPPGSDQMASFTSSTPTCYPILDDELVYVCKSGCFVSPVNNCITKGDGPNTPFYGDTHTVYDIYMRLADYPTPGVPLPITQCLKQTYNLGNTAPTTSGGLGGQITPLVTPFPSHSTLQLNTFGIAQPSGTVIEPREYCKPAIYLYPPQKEDVGVRVSVAGPLTYTNPSYPSQGWMVTAYPNGDIFDQNKRYDYLYYESRIPDNLVPSENTGYIVSYADLSHFFTTLLPRLGLNNKEESQFSAYWLASLPHVSYYRISLFPQSSLAHISELTITPHPDTLLRVTLGFEPLDKKISLKPPILPALQKRGAFTVVEWGGLYKKDPLHPFTCLN